MISKIVWINCPICVFRLFDIAGQFDYDSVLSQIELRGREFKQHNYLSIVMPGAHHEYEYTQKLLLAFIHGWMTKLPVIEPQKPPVQVSYSYIEPVFSKSSFIVLLDESKWEWFSG